MNQQGESVCWDVMSTVTIAEIARWCIENRGVNRLLVVARGDNDAPGTLLEPRVQDAVTKVFGERIIRALWARAWAGTELLGGSASAKVWVIAFDEHVATRMIAAEPLLRCWRHVNEQPLPEDICLYRAGDALPTLVSVTHDAEAWLFDATATNAGFVARAQLPLPADLIPAASDFVMASG